MYREKLADFIKGLLSAKNIRPSTSPWFSPIVVIITKNGEDKIVYRLLTGKSADKNDGISNTVDQWTFTRHKQSDVVLLTGYSKRVLVGGDEGTSKKHFNIHHAVRLVWMATDAVRVEKRSTDLPTPDRQCIVWLFGDRCRYRCLLYGVVQKDRRDHRRRTGYLSETFCARSKIVHRWHIYSNYIVNCFLRKSRGIATCMRQTKVFYQPDQTFLGTRKGGLSWSSSITRWIGSPLEGSRIAG